MGDYGSAIRELKIETIGYYRQFYSNMAEVSIFPLIYTEAFEVPNRLNVPNMQLIDGPRNP